MTNPDLAALSAAASTAKYWLENSCRSDLAEDQREALETLVALEAAYRTGIRVGSLLYAHPPASPTADVVEIAQDALNLAEALHESYDYLGTGSNSRIADKECAEDAAKIKRLRAALAKVQP